MNVAESFQLHGDRRHRQHRDRHDHVNIIDDVPSVTAVGSGVTLALDEGNTNSGAPPISTPATINTGAIVKGDDPDVAGIGSISQAVSAGALVTPTIAFGATVRSADRRPRERAMRCR